MSLRRSRLQPGLAAGLGACLLVLAALAPRGRRHSPVSTGGIILAPPVWRQRESPRRRESPTCRRETI